MDRGTALAEVSARLGTRRLVWAGLRGDDAEPLVNLSQFSGSFTIVNSYHNSARVEAMAYEDLLGVRVDPEVWDIDQQLAAPETVEFRRSILRALSGPSALLPYRPSSFLSSIWFARRDRCINLGLFGGHQSAFEHKPWVETAVAELGLPRIPWTYIADEEQLTTRSLIHDGPVMLRRSRTSGGEGIVRVDSASELAEQWPHVDEGFVSVAPYLDHGIPVNIGGTVWRDGITIHYPSVQLIGIPSCVTRPFGYCGNDFGIVREFERGTIDAIEDSTHKIGLWLRSQGYLGTFGVDYLVRDGQPLFTEINPRFQGSTHISSQISVERDEADLLLEHMAAMLGVPAPQSEPLRHRVRDLADIAHVVVHWTGRTTSGINPLPLVRAMSRLNRGSRADGLTRPDLQTSTGALVARLMVRERLTATGFELLAPYESELMRWKADVDRLLRDSRTVERNNE